MIDRVLIEGCSYVEMFSMHSSMNYNNTYRWPDVFSRINVDSYDIWGKSGSGNHAIAMRTLHHVARENYDRVIVIWSGVNRLDAVVPKQIHNLQKNPYEYVSILDDLVYYHCGNLFNVDNSKIPRVLDEYFVTQIKGSSLRYFTDLTLHNVILVQSVLQSRGIDYKMAWMYDPHADYSETPWWPGCGQLDNTSPLYHMVDWTKINAVYPYEWCLARDMMHPDGFHWSWEGGFQWFKQIMNEDVCNS